jgi:hypothetical protein
MRYLQDLLSASADLQFMAAFSVAYKNNKIPTIPLKLSLLQQIQKHQV